MYKVNFLQGKLLHTYTNTCAAATVTYIFVSLQRHFMKKDDSKQSTS